MADLDIRLLIEERMEMIEVFFSEHFSDLEDPHGAFSVIVSSFVTKHKEGWAFEESVQGQDENGKELSGSNIVRQMLEAIACGVWAAREDKNEWSWVYFSEMCYLSGVIEANFHFKQVHDDPKKIGSLLGHISQKENQSLKEFAVDYWRKNIDPSLSAEKAASILKEKNIVDLRHRTLAAAISKEKNRLKNV